MARKVSRSGGSNRTVTSQRGGVATSPPPPRRRPASGGGGAAPPRRRSADEELVFNFFMGVALFALAFLVFWQAFHAGFIWDDDQLLTHNPLVQGADGWWRVWVQGTADYFPLTTVTLWLEWRLWAMNAGGYHVTNVLLHATTVVLTWQTLKRLRIPGAWVAAAIFAVHPVCVESVAWISERKNTISQIFFLLSIIHYVRFEEKGKTWRYVAAVICFTLALLAKTAVVMLPFILLLLAWWRYSYLEPMRPSYELKKNPLERWVLLIGVPAGMAIAAGLAAWFGWQMLEAQPVLAGFAKGFGQGNGTLLVSLIAAGFGAVVARKLDPAVERKPFEELLLWAGVVALAMIGAAAGAIVGGHVLGGLGMIGMMLGAIVLGAIFSAIGLFTLWLLDRVKLESLLGFEFIRTIPFFAVALLLGAVTIYFQYGKAIGEEVIPIGNLWQRTCSACFAAGFYLYSALWPFNIIEIYPEWHRAFFTPELFPTPHLAPPAREAIPYIIQVLPGLVIAALLFYCWLHRAAAWGRAMLTGLGCYFIAMLPALGFLTMSYMRLTLVADHFQYISIIAVIALVVAGGFQRALRPVYLFAAAACFAVISYLNRSQTQDNYVEQFVWIAGTIALGVAMLMDEEVWTWAWRGFLGLVLICFTVITFNQAGIYESEGTLWSATLAKNPNSWQAHNHLGAYLYMTGDIKGAFPHFLRATQLKPENPESHNNLGLALSYFGYKQEAIKQYQLAVKIKDDSAMDTNLGNAYEELKEFPEAIKEYQHALEVSPENASAWCNMGYALMMMGNIDAAIPCFMKTIELDPGMPQGPTDLSQALKMQGINPDAPVLSGSYDFDVQHALELLRLHPPPPPQQSQLRGRVE